MKELFFAFLREKRMILLLSLGIFLIFGVVYNLYAVAWEAYFYALCLSGAAALLTFVLSFARFCARHRERQSAQAALPQIFDRLPAAESLAERDYQAMILTLGRHAQALDTAYQMERQESLDYYTAWAHQIKTPIAVMQMILQGEDTEEHRELSAELFRIQQYVDMVLSFIRLGSDSSDFVFRECDLDELIRQSIRKYAPQFIRKKIRLNYAQTDARVLTDEKWLCFILDQLLSNAVKYTYQGSVTISVSQEQVLTIRDTGIGIAPEDLPRIFEKGFTGYNGRADKKSTGLGLYLCKQAAEKLSISVSAQSTPGVGTAVSLDLKRRPLGVE